MPKLLTSLRIYSLLTIVFGERIGFQIELSYSHVLFLVESETRRLTAL